MPERHAPTGSRRAGRGSPRLGPTRRPGRRRPEREPDPDRSERITLIEFTWVNPAGAQPVLFLSRKYLH